MLVLNIVGLNKSRSLSSGYDGKGGGNEATNSLRKSKSRRADG